MFSQEQCEEAMDVTSKFGNDMAQVIETARNCAQTCVLNMEGDTFAEKAGNDLNNKLVKVEEVLNENISAVLEWLQEQLEIAIKNSQYSED